MSYNIEDMNVLNDDIDNTVCSKCNCVHSNHAITFKDGYDSMKKLKHSKSDGCTDILSDHIIHVVDRLAGY